MKLIFASFLAIHGLIHLMGFAKAFGYGNITQLTQEVPKSLGTLWLLTALFFVGCAVQVFLKKEGWALLAVGASVMSQILILTAWEDAKFGTLANIFVALAVLMVLGARHFEQSYREDVLSAMGTSVAMDVPITEKDLESLPFPVQNYLRYVDVVGKPQVQNFKINFEGQMRNRDKDWFHFASEQYNFFADPARFFFMKAKVNRIPTCGYHAYTKGTAGMRIKLLSLFPIVTVDSPKMFATETVTFLNDLCLFAPARLIDERIVWQTMDERSAKATFVTGDTRVSATLHFNEIGQLVNFVSLDRSSVPEMKTFPFSTPVKEYRNINGYNLPTYGETIWHYPDGEFVYGKFYLKSIAYNLPPRIDRA